MRDESKSTPSGPWTVHRLRLAASGAAAAAALTAAAGVGYWAVQRHEPAPQAASAPRQVIASLEVSSSPFGLLVDPGFSAPAKLEIAPAAPPAQAALPPQEVLAPKGEAEPQLDDVPLPPRRDDAERVEDNVPLPPVRPSDFGVIAPAERRPAPPAVVARPAAVPSAPSDDRSLFQKLFASAQPGRPTISRSLGAPLPAAPVSGITTVARTPVPVTGLGGGGFGSLFAPSTAKLGYDQYTAVYDIAARTVYLPDGSRLEAHSGLGDKIDNPRFVHERMHGPTPPHLYSLKMREALFHGVQALRLDPIGGGGVFGRAGFLAHTYMLGPNGDSNGCVSFRDYDAFLRAYQNGRINKLAVVAGL